ncbi:MAG TPA: response regulator [Ktedonosporobacter sp.]|nr:response regulator [Ktedonosporobacter sp.]
MLFAIIEDNVQIAHIITEALQMRDHSVRHFFDGASFFASLQTPTYDFILVDLNLPGMVSGLQIVAFLQEKRVPMLIVSGASESVLKSLQTLYPTLPILRKPFSITALLQSVEKTPKPQ